MTRGKRVWKWTRRLFRWSRIAALIFLLIAAVSLLYLNQIGLPDFLKARIVAALEAEGLNVQFAKLHLKGYRRVFIDDVRLSATNAAAPMHFSARQAQLNFNREELKALRFKIEAVQLDDGRLALSLNDTNAPDRALTLENIQAELQLGPGDRWLLRNFTGDAAGARWNISGALTNLMAVTRKTRAGPKKERDITPTLRGISQTLDQLQFSSSPQVTVTVLADLKDLAGFKASLSVRGDSAQTPWGKLEGLILRSSVGPVGEPGQSMEGNVNLQFSRAATRWGELTDATLLGHTVYPLTNSAGFESSWTIRAGAVATRWASGHKVEFTANTRSSGTNLLTLVQGSAENGNVLGSAADHGNFQARLEHSYPIAAVNVFLVDALSIQPAFPLPAADQESILSLGQNWVGDWRVHFDGFHTRNGAAGKLAFSGDIRERSDPVKTGADWGFWEELAPFLITWQAEASDFRADEARLERVSASGQWRAPELTVASVDSQLYNGSFRLGAVLDVPSRALRAEVKTDFDLKQIAWLLDPEVRPFLDQFAWQAPPRIEARVALAAPSWTGTTNDSREEIFKSAVVDGLVTVGPASFRGVECASFQSHFSLTNFQWRLPDAVLARPEGVLHLDYTGHAFEPEFRLAIRGGVDPWAALPLLDREGQIGLKFVRFPEPPFIEGLLTGDLERIERLRFEGVLAATNIIVRGEPFTDVKTTVGYSNQWLYFSEPIAHRTSNEVLSARAAGIDLKRGLMFVTNGFSTTDPVPFTKVIGPGTYRAIEPYKFARNPTVRAEGTIPLFNERDADLRFQVSGEEFAYWRFNMAHVEGGIHWHHQFLDVTNLTAKFYGGDLDWEGHFTFKDDDTADYSFKGVCTNVNVTDLLRDLLPGATNRIEGTLQGTLVINEANSETLQSWKGHGEATLKNGFLWDIPIFGVLSPALDAVAPGFGKSRVSSGAGTFRVDGGKVYTKDMEVRAPAFRLKYDGSVDFDGNLDALVEAQLFRDAWIFGRAVSVAFWPLAKAFESKISGNLSAPKSELAHIPKVILFPLRPIQTIKELLPKDKEKEKKSD